MEKIVKARKVYKCECCNGNIQIGEKHKHSKIKASRYDDEDNQIGIKYFEFRSHNRDCFPRLLHLEKRKEILKNCNYGIHSPTYDMDPDTCDDNTYCEWCGKTLN